MDDNNYGYHPEPPETNSWQNPDSNEDGKIDNFGEDESTSPWDKQFPAEETPPSFTETTKEEAFSQNPFIWIILISFIFLISGGFLLKNSLEEKSSSEISPTPEINTNQEITPTISVSPTSTPTVTPTSSVTPSAIPTPTNTPTPTPENSNYSIEITTPTEGETVTSPLSIQGVANQNWSVNDQIRIKILNSSRGEIYSELVSAVFVQAECNPGEIYFSTEFNFVTSHKNGYLVIEKVDDSSQNYEITLNFKQSTATN